MNGPKKTELRGSLRATLGALRGRFHRLLYRGVVSGPDSRLYARLNAEFRASCVNVVVNGGTPELVSRRDRSRSLWLEYLELSSLRYAVGVTGVDIAAAGHELNRACDRLATAAAPTEQLGKEPADSAERSLENPAEVPKPTESGSGSLVTRSGSGSLAALDNHVKRVRV